MIKGTAVLAALLALVFGLRAAWLWYQSSLVKPEPEGPEPVVAEIRNMWWQSAQIEAADRSAELNGRAAKWTAAAVVVGQLPTLPVCLDETVTRSVSATELRP
jgi:hypothetical protein